MSLQVISEGDGACSNDCVEHHLDKTGIHFFTAEWCNHCRNMKENFGAKPWKSEKGNDTWGMWEHDSEVEISTEELEAKGYEKIMRYPTIYFKKQNGKAMRYQGAKDLKSLHAAFNKFLVT